MYNLKQEDIKTPRYEPAIEQEETISFVKKRFMQMQQARSVVDKNWDIYQQMLNATYVQYPDERSSSVVPLSSSLVELYVAETLKLQTQFNIKAETSKSNTNAKALDYVWKYDWRKNNRKKAFLRWEYTCWWFWTNIMYVWYEVYTLRQKELVANDNWKMTWQEKEYQKSWIIVDDIDIRKFYLDDQAIYWIEWASDCIYRERLSFERFKTITNDKVYFDTDKVTPRQYSNEYNVFITAEENTKVWQFVEVMHYRNVDKDVYCQIANWVLIREHPIMSTIDGLKALPFVVRGLWYKNYSIYYRWICEAVMMFQSEVNTLRELLMDAIRRSNTQVLAIGNWLSFDWRTFSYDNEILTFDWDLWWNFQQISWNPPNQAIFWYLDRLYKDIAMYIWIDIQNIIWTSAQTAYQTEVQREASQKRINVRLENRDLAYERFWNLYKDALQTYFPLKTAEWLYPEIEIEWQKFKNWKFVKAKWKSMFQVTPEVLQWDLFVDVYTNRNAPTINAVDREQKMGFLNSLWTMLNWYMIAQQSWVDLEWVLPIKDTIKSLAEDFNLTPVYNKDTEEVETRKNEVMDWLKNMLISWTNTQWNANQQIMSWWMSENFQPSKAV